MSSLSSYGIQEIFIKEKNIIPLPDSVFEYYNTETVYLSLGMNCCLCVYYQQSWDKFVEKIKTLPRDHQIKMRILFANVIAVKRNDVIYSPKLCEFAYLEKGTKAILFETADRIELWNESLFNNQYSNNE